MDWTAATDAHGILDLRALKGAGLDTREIARLVRGGQLTRLARGWYFAGATESPEQWHELATRALLKSHEGRAVASYHSALVMHGLPTYLADLTRVRLSRRTVGSPRTRRGLSLGRAVPEELIIGETVHPALAAVQVGTAGSPVAALIAASGALHARLATTDDLEAALSWATRYPGAAPVGPMLALADERHASAGESRVALALHLMRLEAVPQFEVKDGAFLAYADFGLPTHGVLVEFDGRMKYGRQPDRSDDPSRRRTPGEIAWDEKVREDHLRGLDWEVVRIIWAELDDGAKIARKIEHAMERARRRSAA